MSSCLVNTVQLTTNADRQLLIAFVIKRFIMITITKWGSKELEVGTEFDQEQELEITILNNDGDDTSVWLKKEEVKRLIEHLQNVL